MKFNLKKLFYILIITLCFSIMSISVGFSAMSTTLTVNGTASFEPVEMIRIVGLEKESDTKEIDKNYTINTINVFIDTEENETAIYNIKIANLGQTEQVISKIEDEIFSNENMEYEIEGYEENQIIKPKETINIKLKLKNKDIRTRSTNNKLNLKIKFYFEKYVFIPNDYTIIFNSNGGIGEMEKTEYKYNEEKNIPLNKYTNGTYIFKNWNTKEDGTGYSFSNGELIKNINYNNEKEIILYAQWMEKNTYGIYYDGICDFGGKGIEVKGDCAKDSKKDYVDTGIKPFSNENYQKNFILTLTLDDIDNSRLGSGKRDTFFSALYEANDNIKGRYPGVLLRVENKKIVLHISNGHQTSDYATDISFTKDEFINKEFKLIRYNDGTSIKFYYILGDNEPILYRDLTDLSATFDTPLTFGANVAIDNKTPDRHTVGKLRNISFEFTNSETIEGILKIQKPQEPTTVVDTPIETITLQETNQCIFNGQNANIEGCSNYIDQNYINTNINLFSSENYQKDFDVSFNIDNYNSDEQEVAQVTLMNAFKERTGKGYGMLLRKNKNNLELIIRDGNELEKTVTLSANSIQSLRIIRKNKKIYYSINNETLKFAISVENFGEPFDVPLTFGASIDQNGQPFRFIKGTLSNINVVLGQIDPNINFE